jgi:hypothetical protein
MWLKSPEIINKTRERLPKTVASKMNMIIISINQSKTSDYDQSPTSIDIAIEIVLRMNIRTQRKEHLCDGQLYRHFHEPD